MLNPVRRGGAGAGVGAGWGDFCDGCDAEMKENFINTDFSIQYFHRKLKKNNSKKMSLKIDALPLLLS